MDQKGVKSKNKLLKFLPRASSVTFQNPPFSPGRDKRSDHKPKTHLGRGFSGPIVSFIPAESRRKPNPSRFETQQEPTSPKISCMGQIKHKKNICKQKSFSDVKTTKPFLEKKPSTFRNVFKTGKLSTGRKSDCSADHYKPPLPDRAPSLSQMKRFASGRDSFTGFDWTAQIAPVDSDDRNYYSDEEEEVIIPSSAPRALQLQPRKEINLWKRRPMDQPKPLQLNILV